MQVPSREAYREKLDADRLQNYVCKSIATAAAVDYGY